MKWVEKLRRLVPEASRRRPQVAMVIGIECSGKTTFYEDKLSGKGYKRVSVDEVYHGLIKDPGKSFEAPPRDSEEKNVYYPTTPQELDQILQLQALRDTMSRAYILIRRGEKVALDGRYCNSEFRD